MEESAKRRGELPSAHQPDDPVKERSQGAQHQHQDSDLDASAQYRRQLVHDDCALETFEPSCRVIGSKASVTALQGALKALQQRHRWRERRDVRHRPVEALFFSLNVILVLCESFSQIT